MAAKADSSTVPYVRKFNNVDYHSYDELDRQGYILFITFFRAFFTDLAFFAFLVIAGNSLIGPGGIPCLRALPLGVTEGGNLKLNGGKGLWGFQTKLFFIENLTLFVLFSQVFAVPPPSPSASLISSPF
ncbi:hypothetical protein V6N11_062688 [Hibiscus sabdariffa]|uniref:Uncharacterized protein n=1 Tax=Hibiscus sabdariffa TaxID=183260 RepID=A0ABR2PTD8_9ROSI